MEVMCDHAGKSGRCVCVCDLNLLLLVFVITMVVTEFSHQTTFLSLFILRQDLLKLSKVQPCNHPIADGSRKLWFQPKRMKTLSEEGQSKMRHRHSMTGILEQTRDQGAGPPFRGVDSTSS